ncbi:arabinose efflux permease family protein [Desulfocapsa sulfexigens DSM 10523]|uniref:Arabinose efflux permease family protein n=1 Tax=Desulfocapsa sulfexigens (strain DSM 10523 / SB164P1) TaxID=1167006 RepID=M1PEU9_DESSD|nr:MFS transporter [Desulfocapsa sulfexigens]AGF78235.1 arabinose efflux permease family protein [Desulfocapsa sulfexigens DSM 10523]
MQNTKHSSFKAAEILLLSFCHFIHDVYSSFLAPLLPLLIDKLSMSLTQAGFLSAVMQLPALMNPFIGMLADRASLRYFVILAPMMTAIPMSLIGLAPTYGVLLLLLFIAGISIAMFHVPAPVMIARMAGSRKGRGMSFFMTGGELARTIGPLIAVSAVSLLGFEGIWPIMIVGIAASVWLFVRFRNVDLSFHNNGNKISLITTFKEMRHILMPLTFILLARSFMHGSMTAFLPLFIQNESGSIWLGGMALMLFEAAGVAGVLTAGSLSDYLGRRRVLLISLVGAPLSVLLFVISNDWVRMVSLVSCGFMILSTTPVMLALIQEHAKNSPAAANGMFMLIAFMARASMVVVIGMIADRSGLQSAYLVSAAVGLLGIPFILMLPGRTRS